MASTALTTALGVHGGGVDVAAVLGNQAIPEQQHVAAGKGDLAPVEAGVVHVELGDQRVGVAPHVDDLVPKGANRAEKSIHGADKAALPWTGSAFPRRSWTSSVMNAANAGTSFASKALKIARTWSAGFTTLGGSGPLMSVVLMSRKPDQVEAGEGTVELLHLPAATQGAEVDGEEPSVLEERDRLGLRVGVVT
jgi:hypothetical protein